MRISDWLLGKGDAREAEIEALRRMLAQRDAQLREAVEREGAAEAQLRIAAESKAALEANLRTASDATNTAAAANRQETDRLRPCGNHFTASPVRLANRHFLSRPPLHLRWRLLLLPEIPGRLSPRCRVHAEVVSRGGLRASRARRPTGRRFRRNVCRNGRGLLRTAATLRRRDCRPAQALLPQCPSALHDPQSVRIRR